MDGGSVVEETVVGGGWWWELGAVCVCWAVVVVVAVTVCLDLSCWFFVLDGRGLCVCYRPLDVLRTVLETRRRCRTLGPRCRLGPWACSSSDGMFVLEMLPAVGVLRILKYGKWFCVRPGGGPVDISNGYPRWCCLKWQCHGHSWQGLFHSNQRQKRQDGFIKNYD